MPRLTLNQLSSTSGKQGPSDLPKRAVISFKASRITVCGIKGSEQIGGPPCGKLGCHRTRKDTLNTGGGKKPPLKKHDYRVSSS